VSGKQAKKLRKIIFDQSVLERAADKLVAVEPALKKATIRYTQRKLYLRAKKIFARLCKGQHVGFFADTARASHFVNEALVTKLI
jgi:hypothetical protein